MTIGAAVRYLKKGEWEKAHPIVQEDESSLGAERSQLPHASRSQQADT